MNEQHVIAAILTAGLVARGNGDELHPRDVVSTYQLMLAELLTVIRPQRPAEDS